MQPEKRRGRAAAASRARLLIKAHLGWIGGYPIAAQGGQLIWSTGAIDRAAIASATRATKRLLGEYRAVLPDLVGDPVTWSTAIEAALAALKRSVHGDAEPGDLLDGFAAEVRARGRRIGAARPPLGPLVSALSWSALADPARLAGDLVAVERHAASFQRLVAIETGLALVRIAREGEARIAGLMAALAEPAIATALGDYPTRLGRRMDGQILVSAARPEPVLPGALIDLLPWMAAAERPLRRAALAAIATLDIPSYLDRWRRTWSELEPAEAIGARSRESRARLPAAEVTRARMSLVKIPPAAPSPLTARQLRRIVQRLAGPDARQLMGLAAALPVRADAPTRLEFLVSLEGEIEQVDAAGRAPFIRLLRRLADRPGWRALVPLLVGAQIKFGASLGDILPAARWPLLAEAIAMTGREALDASSALRLAALVDATGDAAAAVPLLPALETRAVSPWSHAIRVAVALGVGPEQVGDLVARFGRDDDAIAVERLWSLIGPAGARLLRALLEDDESGRLRQAATWIDLVKAARVRVPPLMIPDPSQAPDWARRYPAALAGPLAMAEAAGARAAAERRLAELFPDPDRLRREIEAIDRRIETAPTEQLVRRRDNLVARLAAPRRPPPQRLARLAADIERSARVALFDAWVAGIERSVLSALPGALGLDDAPDWLVSRDHRAVVAGAVALKGEDQKLARRLLAVRAGPPPWDLRDAPRNRAFVARLSGRGLDLRPWVDGIPPMTMIDDSGTMVLSLEDDPLEVLRMGEHFSTCLSPGGINFYSAVVNAIDINKRVVYGRDDKGAVIGRCLIALTDDGKLLTFHPYAHRGDFESMMRVFAAELAGRIGTAVHARGKVTPLVASRWYDDGTHDLTGRHEFLADGSSFRARLLTMPVEELVDALSRELELDGASLSLVIALPELDARPELVVPLLPLIDRAGDVPLEVRLRVIGLAERIGAAAELGPRTARYLEAGLQGRIADGGVGLDPIERLARLAPLRMLAVVREARRRLRPRARDGNSLLAYGAALAHRELGRPKRAAEEFRRALAATSDPPLERACREALGR